MRITVLNGSPRRDGNTAYLLDHLLEPAATHGADIRQHMLNDLDYRGCQACFACKNAHDACILQDDLTDILEEINETDVLVLATPVYYGDVTAQLKGFIDRTFGLLVPKYYRQEPGQTSRLAPGKAIVFMVVQGAVDAGRFADIIPRYREFFTLLGFSRILEYRAEGVYWEGQAEKRQDHIDEAVRIGRRIIDDQ